MKPWLIRYAGLTFTDDDLTGADLVACQALVNDGWNSANPLAGPWHCFAVTAVVVARLQKLDVDDVLSELRLLHSDKVPMPEPRELQAAA